MWKMCVLSSRAHLVCGARLRLALPLAPYTLCMLFTMLWNIPSPSSNLPYPLSLIPPRATTDPVCLSPPVAHVETHDRRVRPSRLRPGGALREPPTSPRRAPPPRLPVPLPPPLPPSGGGECEATISSRVDGESIAARVVC